MQRTTKEVQEVGERWVHFCSGLKELKVYFQAQPAGGAEDSTEMANFPAPMRKITWPGTTGCFGGSRRCSVNSRCINKQGNTSEGASL